MIRIVHACIIINSISLVKEGRGEGRVKSPFEKIFTRFLGYRDIGILAAKYEDEELNVIDVTLKKVGRDGNKQKRIIGIWLTLVLEDVLGYLPASQHR